jgi:hypothetical protein
VCSHEESEPTRLPGLFVPSSSPTPRPLPRLDYPQSPRCRQRRGRNHSRPGCFLVQHLTHRPAYGRRRGFLTMSFLCAGTR